MFLFMRIFKFTLKVGLLNAFIIFSQFNNPAALGQNEAHLGQRLVSDSQTIKTIRNNFSNIISFMKSRPDLFSEEECGPERMSTQAQRQEIRRTWLNFMDQVMALDSIGKQYTDFYLKLEKAGKKKAFRMAYSAFLLQYRYGLEFIGLAERDACLHTILNEPDNALGLPEGTYSQLKFRFLNVGRGSEFLRLNTIYRYYRPDPESILTKGINEDVRELLKAGMGKGSLLTIKNALKIVKNAGVTAWFPVQKGVAQWMGDTKVARPFKVLIKKSQIEEILPKLEPGDILLERREWYLSNIGLPGFWTHAALFIGTSEMRNQYFSDPEVIKFLEKFGKKSETLDQLLKARYPYSYNLCGGIQADGYRPMVIEAVSEGVVFTTIQHSLAADSAAVLRPSLPKVEKALAILRAFHYSGRPYDFNFDFLTDSELVCTELVYKGYEGTETTKGLKLPLKSMLGKRLISANDIAELYAEEHNSGKQQFDFVCFLDGYEHLGKAVIATKEDFLKSWERPKWHVVLQAINND
jgi:uncharacterized protein YycO